eukprot:scaffold242848_cov26-Tisochrysis_lutea.AAC.1
MRGGLRREVQLEEECVEGRAQPPPKSNQSYWRKEDGLRRGRARRSGDILIARASEQVQERVRGLGL